MLDAVVVGSQEAREHSSHRRHVERPGRHHGFEVGLVFGAVEERLEDGEVLTRQEWQLPAGERLQADPSCDLFVELGRVEEQVDWSVLPPQPGLPVACEQYAIVFRRDNLGRSAARAEAVRSGLTNTLTSRSIVARARCVHQAKASAPPNAWLIRAAARLSWMAIILYARPVGSRLTRGHRSGTGET